MRLRPAFVGSLILLLLALLIWKTARRGPDAPSPLSPGTRAVLAPAVVSPTAAPLAPNPVPSTPPPERSTLADALNSPTTDIHADLRLVANLLETFRSNFTSSGNPVGNNADITTALTGRNRLRLALIPLDHPAINREGELCDRWGTPFFFHAESATRMEIRSAGPDQKMWSTDDVVLRP